MQWLFFFLYFFSGAHNLLLLFTILINSHTWHNQTSIYMKYGTNEVVKPYNLFIETEVLFMTCSTKVILYLTLSTQKTIYNVTKGIKYNWWYNSTSHFWTAPFIMGSMNYYPLFRVRSWNNGLHCMSFCILMACRLVMINSIQPQSWIFRMFYINIVNSCKVLLEFMQLCINGTMQSLFRCYISSCIFWCSRRCETLLL